MLTFLHLESFHDRVRNSYWYNLLKNGCYQKFPSSRNRGAVDPPEGYQIRYLNSVGVEALEGKSKISPHKIIQSTVEISPGSFWVLRYSTVSIHYHASKRSCNNTPRTRTVSLISPRQFRGRFTARFPLPYLGEAPTPLSGILFQRTDLIFHRLGTIM